MEKSLWDVVRIYNEHDHVSGGWAFRVEADKKLSAIAGSFPSSFLKKLLAENPRDQGVAMAVAVTLGARELPEASESAELIVRLLSSRFERVRYRAARAIERRASRADLTTRECEVLHDGLAQAIQEEPAQVVREAMETALEALSANPYTKTDG
jgi:DNA-directed RNA polymerase subunit K/omega